MEYKNGTPALCWFSYLGLAATNDMDWNEAEGRPIPKSKTKLKKIATMEFDWLDCPGPPGLPDPIPGGHLWWL